MPLAIVSGALANKPFNGGNAWTRLSWVLGLKRLGFEVIFIEQINRGSCVGTFGGPAAFADSVNVAYFRSVMAQFGLSGSSALIQVEDGQVEGVPLDRLQELARRATLLFNLSGHLTLESLRSPIPCKVYYDDDPGYTQFWEAMGSSGARLSGHDHFYTIGGNIGLPGCEIPTGAIRWRHTRPPVVLADWPVSDPGAFRRFTTVASWRGAYAPLHFGGKTYGLKAHEFRKFMAMPQPHRVDFEMALQIHPGDQKDRDALVAQGWRLVEPQAVADSPDAFRRYVQGSSAEFSVAQGIYVDTHSGWFSDRTVRYLASGRPALVQETGFSRYLPVGDGLLSFRTMDEAVEGAERIVRDYPQHCRAARRVAETCFDSDQILRQLLNETEVKHD